MEDYQPNDEVSFNADEASNYVKECIENVIGGVDYNQNKVNQWTASIVEHSLTQLVKQGNLINTLVSTLRDFMDKLCCNAEEWGWSTHSQFLLLGHHYGWKLHSKVGESDHVLCRLCFAVAVTL